MTARHNSVDDEQVHRFVDGRLAEHEVAAFERLLAEDPDLQRRAHAYSRIDAMMHAEFDGALAEPLPERLRAAAFRRPARAGLVLLRAVAAVALLAVGGTAGWLLNDSLSARTSDTRSLVGRAVSAHVVFAAEVRHPVEVQSSEEAHLVAWLSKRLGVKIRAPKLDARGYQLMGGRLLPADSAVAAQFMYQNPGGQRLTLYVTHNPENRDTAFRFAARDRVNAFYWLDGPLGYVLVGDVQREPLLEAARVVYTAFNE